MSSGQLQLGGFSILVALISVATLAYVATSSPDYLAYSRDGVPHLTPKVAHPQSGEALELGMLIKHYKGELEGGTKVYY